MALFSKKQTTKEKESVGVSAPRFARQVVIRPHVTEKSLRLAHDRQYVFMIDPRASKQEAIKQIEKMYAVTVIKSTTTTKTEKKAHYRGISGSKQKTKKVAVTLAPGQHIDITGTV